MATFGQEQTQSQNNGLSAKFLTYTSGAFVSYNSDLKQEETTSITEFVVLKTGYSLTGWSDRGHSKMYSNEEDTPKGPFNMRLMKDKSTVRTGEYDKVKTKPAINDLGGKLTYVLTVLSNDKMYKLQFTGTAFKEVSDFMQRFGNDMNSYKVKIVKHNHHQKGKIERYIPELTKGAKITEEEYLAAEMVVQSLTPSE